MLSYKILTASQLVKKVVEEKVTVGKFKYGTSDQILNTKHVQYDEQHIVYVCCFDDGTLIGAAKLRVLENSCFHKHTNFWHLGYISVSPNYQNNGISKELAKLLVSWLLQNNISFFNIGTYSANGYDYFRNNIERLLQKYNIAFESVVI